MLCRQISDFGLTPLSGFILGFLAFLAGSLTTFVKFPVAASYLYMGIGLVAVLMQKNEYFILDEPFNGVDIQSNIVITEIIHKLKSLGKTVIISSHIFSTLHDTCDEIYLLKDGAFIRHVLKEKFGLLEQEMKDFNIGSRIETLGLC